MQEVNEVRVVGLYTLPSFFSYVHLKTAYQDIELVCCYVFNFSVLHIFQVFKLYSVFFFTFPTCWA